MGMEELEVKIAFSPDEFVEPRREFRGRIVRAEWGTPSGQYRNDWVFPPGAPEDIRARQEERQAIAVRIEIMPIDKAWSNIYEWYSVSNVRLSKWYYFVQALMATGAMKDINYTGNTMKEQLDNFVKSLLGMEFTWQDHEGLPTVGKKLISRLLLPVKYHGKFEIGRPEVYTI